MKLLAHEVLADHVVELLLFGGRREVLGDRHASGVAHVLDDLASERSRANGLDSLSEIGEASRIQHSVLRAECVETAEEMRIHEGQKAEEFEDRVLKRCRSQQDLRLTFESVANGTRDL